MVQRKYQVGATGFIEAIYYVITVHMVHGKCDVGAAGFSELACCIITSSIVLPRTVFQQYTFLGGQRHDQLSGILYCFFKMFCYGLGTIFNAQIE